MNTTAKKNLRLGLRVETLRVLADATLEGVYGGDQRAPAPIGAQQAEGALGKVLQHTGHCIISCYCATSWKRDRH